MSPFEVARLAAGDARRVLSAQGISTSAKGAELIAAAGKAWRLAIRSVPPNHPLLKNADATINVHKRWIVVRNDLSASFRAFLVAHELGHFFLHRGSCPSFTVTASALEPDVEGNAAVRYVEAYGARERQELQANVFAREFLLPITVASAMFLETGRSATAIEGNLEIPQEVVRLQLLDALLLPRLPPAPMAPVPKVPTKDQEPAVNASSKYTLVEAGPGTGKTTTLLLRLRELMAGGADPTGIFILTFSNKAARELVERLKQSGTRSVERVWVGTFHSFGLEFLRKFGTLCGLQAQVNVMDRLGALSLLEDVLPDLPLKHYDPLGDPIGWLPAVLVAISRCKDDLIDAAAYRAEVVRHPDVDATAQARRLDAAALFEAYEKRLSAKHAVDFNDLLGRTVALMKQGHPSIEEYLHAVQHVLVDEYQDVNRASALLVKSLAAHASSVWAVGDAHQAVYAFMGASSRNIADFGTDFPGAVRIPLGANHRSSQEIADAFHRLSTASPDAQVAPRLTAEKGSSGLSPLVITCDDEADELDTLAARLISMRPEVPFGSQAVLVYSNAMATSVAQGLERRGLPVLYLGNIFERAEIKELLCLLHLSVDKAGASLGSDWVTPELKVPYEDVVKLRNASDEDSPDERAWWERDRAGVSDAGLVALRRLDNLTAPLRGLVSPWDALCTVLLEDGQILRRLCADSAQSAVNARLATWQFVHSCRIPDGIVQYPTIRNLFDRIRRRIRLGQDKILRQVPPEAEGLDAVHVLTMHQSKGLEFDAVNLLEMTCDVYEPKQKRQWPLVPTELLERLTQIDEHRATRIERHNLMYVGLSRARKHVAVYRRKDEALPGAMNGICRPQDALARVVLSASVARPPFQIVETTLEDLVQYKNKCPRRVELSRRVGRVSSGLQPVYRLLDIALHRVLRGLTIEPQARAPAAVAASIEQELRRVDLWDHRYKSQMIARLDSLARTAIGFYNQGGDFDQRSVLRIGGIEVSIVASQVIDVRGQSTLRLMRVRKAQVERINQTLGVLVKTHEQLTGQRVRVQGVVLSDGKTHDPTKVQSPTVDAYEKASELLAKGNFEARPSPFNCPTCPYFMQCDQGVT